MPRTRSLAWAELKIGVISVFAIAMTLLLVFVLTGDRGFFWQRYAVKTVFEDVAGLKAGAPVRLAGVQIGSVSDVRFSGSRVEVVMELAESVKDRVTSGSTASLGSVSLLGESAVDITASLDGTPVPQWGYIKSARPTGSLTDVADQATVGLAEATKLMQDVRAGRGTLGRLVTDEALYAELRGLVQAAEDVAQQVNEGQGSLGRLVRDPAAAKALEAALQNLEGITTRLQAGEGSLGQLLHDDGFARSLSSTTTNLETLTGRLNNGEGTAGKLLTDEALYTSLSTTSERLNGVLAELQKGEGTVGQLLHDRQLYENMNTAVSELRSLVQDIRADPKRFLNVRVSIF